MSVVSFQKLQELLGSSPSDRCVYDEAIERWIKEVSFHRPPGTTVTVCNITLDNGYNVRGEAACVDAKHYNVDISQTLARKDAFSKLVPLFGFLMAEWRLRLACEAEEQAIYDAMEDQEGL